jgi:adenylosuccinate synthase
MTVTIIMGGQYGSEGKGSVVSWLAQNEDYDLAIRTGSVNAGHSFINPDGDKVIMRQLPCTWPFQEAPLYLPSGSIIDLDVLNTELAQLWDWKFRGGVYVSPNAALIEQDAKDAEKNIKTGTTGKGIGATRAKECMRTAKLSKEWNEQIYFADDSNKIHDILHRPESNIIVESTQGFGLSLDYKYYPYCTSSNIMPYQILQDADIPYNIHKVEVWMVIRTFPIRIAGNSGYMFKETNWDSLRERYGSHIPDEYTSVTKKLRRVGEFDIDLVRDAVDRCNPDKVVLTFLDYLFPDIKNTGFSIAARMYLNDIGNMIGHPIDYVGIGTGEILEY